MKDYLNLEGLSHFLTKLLNKFFTKEDVATENEILVLMQEIGVSPILASDNGDAVYTNESNAMVLDE